MNSLASFGPKDLSHSLDFATAGTQTLNMDVKRNALVSGFASGLAGLVTDILLYPLDTVATRLQAKHGFTKAGGFRHMYRGISTVLLASAPNNAIFFSTYETMKVFFGRHLNQSSTWVVSSIFGELVMCSVYVPMTVVQQRAQVYEGMNSWKAMQLTVRSEGYPGLYRGYSIIFLQSLPWSLIHVPLWEYLKTLIKDVGSQGYQNTTDISQKINGVSALESGLCGALSAVVTSVISNPIDVSKTRTVLAKPGSKVLSMNLFRLIWHISLNEGFRKLYAGFLPRTLASAVGGFVYLGLYEKVKLTLSPGLQNADTC